MTILEMLRQSALLAVMGMAIVFLFLWIMIICVSVTGVVIRKMGWDKDVADLHVSPSKQSDKTAQSSLIAVISAAVQEYRKTEKGDS
ncbi:MAG: OadG family protein [Spirochaetaceae bacterium]|jgi:oxaloacetate decarboxylase gamma subunit|nr:OadG family protein [Spirochaetaceae bacterium]